MKTEHRLDGPIPVCRQCRFWNLRGAFPNGLEHGAFQRNAPTCTGYNAFPVTMETDWCGEWKQKLVTPVQEAK